MSSKNSSFLGDLAAGVSAAPVKTERAARQPQGILGNRANRLAELTSGTIVDKPQQLVDPARCRIWEHHNRDYKALTRERCSDLIESLIAQGGQDMAAIVRRVSDDPEHDFEVIAGARRHWSISWLRANNYPDFRYLVEVRSLTDEQAFRLSDLENRAREDLSDLERARDYLKALDLYYHGKQREMAARLNQSEAWLSRYLDLARLPDEIIAAFADPFELKISHIKALKPILKPAESRAFTLAEAKRIAADRADGNSKVPVTVPDVLRALVTAAAGPKVQAKSAPKKTGLQPEVLRSETGVPLLRIEAKDRKTLGLTLFCKGGGTRAEAEAALQQLLDQHWPTTT